MKTVRTKIGSFEAKTHLSSLIDDVQKGNEYIITRRGRPVARLVPYENSEAEPDVEEIISRLDSIRGAVKGTVNIRQYIAEGRKH